MNKKWVFIWAVVSSAIAQGQMNPIEGGTTQMVSGQWDVAVPWLMVGSNSGSNQMHVMPGGQVNNQVGIIGNNVGSSNNKVLLLGGGSQWNNALELTVGHLGASNELEVAAGGAVTTDVAYIGKNSDANTVRLIGDGAAFHTDELHIGYQGDGNVLENLGGRVSSDSASIGHWIGSDGNMATIAGVGSWTNSGILNIGEYGAGNTLNIQNGGWVGSPIANVGAYATASNNLVSVSGAGANFQSQELNIGGTKDAAGGTGNRVEVGNGGRIETTDLIIYGGNHFDLNAGYLVVNNDFDASMEGFSWGNGGRLTIKGEFSGLPRSPTAQSYALFDGYYKNLTLDGGSWDPGTGQSISIGHTGDFNSLVLTNGATAAADLFFSVGTERNADGNSVLVHGGGSELIVGSKLSVGYEGSCNLLQIRDGGRLSSDGGFVGALLEADDNLIHVSGTGSLWQSSAHVGVGGYGQSNQMIISNGGSVHGQTGVVGLGHEFYIDTGNANSVLISGAGSEWITAEELIVGQYGESNRIVVEEGGLLESNSGIIGDSSQGDNNEVLITGVGSHWRNSLELVVGDQGAGNTLFLEDGGRVITDEMHLGAFGDDNQVVVRGTGSLLQVSDSLEIGQFGSRNAISVLDGGRMQSSSSTIGYNAGASENSALVSGTGSTWINQYDLSIGVFGSENVLTVDEGGGVLAVNGLIGVRETATGNAVVIKGVGSELQLLEDLYVGHEGQSSAMEISDGGVVEIGRYLNLGYHQSASNSSVLVSGTDSSLSAEYIFVGAEGSRLKVADGARVNSFGLHINLWGTAQVKVEGQDSVLSTGLIDIQSDGNEIKVTDGGIIEVGALEVLGNDSSLLVSGTGSALIDDEQLTLNGEGNQLQILNSGNVEGERLLVYGGQNQVTIDGAGSIGDFSKGQLLIDVGSSNQVEITEGGKLLTGSSYVGIGGASDNSVLVSGEESAWMNTFDLGIGESGSNNRLQILGGGSVGSDNGTIGWDSGSTDNQVLVDGHGSVWSNAGQLVVGYSGSANKLNISDLGYTVNQEGYIGYASGADDNVVSVNGAGSYWFNQSGLSVGHGGSGNALEIDSGGVAQVWGNSHIGYMGNSNSVKVSGEYSAFGTGVMVPRVYVAQPVIPTNIIYPGGGSHWVIVTPPEIGVIPEAENLVIVTNGGSFGSGGEGIYYQQSNNVISVGGGSFTGGVGGMVSGSGNSAALGGGGTISGGTFVSPISYKYELSFGDLVVGSAGSYNTLDINDGGLAATWNGFVGETSTAWFNAVSVTGTNSEFKVYNDLSLGGRMSPMYELTSNGWKNEWLDGGRGNSLYVGDGGLVSVGRNLDNRNYSSITIDPGASINVRSNYYQDATSMLKFGVETNSSGAPVNALLSVGGTAEFEAGAGLDYASNVGRLDFDTFYTNKIIEADALIVAGIENPDSLDLELLDASGSLVDVLFWEDDSDIYGLVGRVHLAESAGFATNSMMGRLSREMDDMSLLGDEGANRLINLLNGMSGAQQYNQLMQQYAKSTPNYLHSRSMTEGMREIKKHGARYERAQAKAPQGVSGPYAKDQGLQGWVKPYGSWSDYDAVGDFSGYEHNIYGTVVGFDLPMDGALLGIAGGYGRSVISQDDVDSSEARTGYGVIYFTRGTEDWFGHLNVAFGKSKVDQNSGSVFENDADFDASNFAVYLEGGKEMMLNRRLSIIPKASVLWSYYYQQSYSEISAGGTPRDVAAYENDSILSSLGAALAYRKPLKNTVLKPEARLYWLHEFNAETDSVDYQLQNGTGIYQFVMPAPNEDVIEAGLGLSILFNDELELVLDVDGRLGENYSGYAVSGRVNWEF